MVNGSGWSDNGPSLPIQFSQSIFSKSDLFFLPFSLIIINTHRIVPSSSIFNSISSLPSQYKPQHKEKAQSFCYLPSLRTQTKKTQREKKNQPKWLLCKLQVSYSTLHLQLFLVLQGERSMLQSKSPNFHDSDSQTRELQQSWYLKGYN